MANYLFGAFQINANSGGYGYFIESKTLHAPTMSPAVFPIARRDGGKRSGERVNPRQIDLDIKVIGSSRTDLLSRLDSLQQALSLRSQSLLIHDSGTRYYQSVDCFSAETKLGPGNVVACLVACKFLAADPYAYATTSSSYDTGTVALTLSSSLWNFPSISITGGGTYYSYPLLHIINKTSTGNTTLTSARNSGTSYTTIAVAATSFSGSTGDQITITHSGTTQTLTASSGWSVGATTINVNSFTASANYVSGDVAAKVTQWTSISVAQTNDSQTISANSTSATPLPSANGDYVDFQCDPAQTAGMTIQTNGSGKYSDPNGVFPVVEPGLTTFNISIACASAVSAECIVSWVSRYVS